MSQIAKPRRRRIFLGWWTVLVGGVLALWGHGVHLYSFGAFLKPVAADLGAGRAILAGAGSMTRLEGGIVAFLGGWIVDRYGPRLVCMSGMFLGGLGFMLMYFVHSVLSFYATWFVASLGFSLGVTIPIDAAVANWFVKRRGLAIALLRSIVSFSGITIVPLVTLLIQSFGWREAFIVAGVVTWVLTLPLAWLFIKPKRPGFYGLLPDGADPDTTLGPSGVVADVKYAQVAQEFEFSLRQAVKTLTFWMLWAANLCRGMVAPAVAVHQIAYLTDRGINPMAAAGAIGLMLLFSLPGRLTGGILVDRVPKRRLPLIMAAGYFFQMIGLVIFLLVDSIPMVYVYLCIYGFGYGIAVGADSPLRARFFGRKAFASISGLLRFLYMPAGILAPIYAGWVYDVTGTYRGAFILMAALLGAAVVVMASVKPPRPPRGVADATKVL